MVRRKTDPPRGILATTVPDARRFRHARHHPSADLAPYVEHYWTVEWDLRGCAAERAETLPHPSVHLIIEPGGKSRLAGVSRARFTRVLEGKSGVYAVKFTPAGFHPMVGVPVSRFTDRTVLLRDVFGAAGAALERDVLAEGSDSARIAHFEAFLRGRVAQPDENVSRISAIVYSVARDRAILRVDDIVRRAGLTARTLQRLFARYVGVTPKWVIQRYRLHEAAAALAAPSPVSQAALALALGYSDQAHFVRDFRGIVGVTPAAYARAARRHGAEGQP